VATSTRTALQFQELRARLNKEMAWALLRRLAAVWRSSSRPTCARRSWPRLASGHCRRLTTLKAPA